VALLGEILIAGLQVAAGAGLAAGARWTRNQVRVRRPAAKIWSVGGRPVHIITAQDDSDFVAEFTVKVYPAEYLAAVEVRAILCETLCRGDVDLLTSSDFPMGRLLSDNLVCVGGPIHNRVSRVVLDRLKLPVGFDGYSVVSTASGRRYEAKCDPVSGKIVRDIGLVVIDTNPFNADSLVVLLMGSRTFGCPAASRFITSNQLKSAHAVLGDTRPRWVVLDVDVVDDFVVRIDVLESAMGVHGAARKTFS
jgi:hypothetical protein